MMQIIISPAKKMNLEKESPYALSQPALLDKTQVLLAYLQSLDVTQLKALLKCNEQIARLTLRHQLRDQTAVGAGDKKCARALLCRQLFKQGFPLRKCLALEFKESINNLFHR